MDRAAGFRALAACALAIEYGARGVCGYVQLWRRGCVANVAVVLVERLGRLLAHLARARAHRQMPLQVSRED